MPDRAQPNVRSLAGAIAIRLGRPEETSQGVISFRLKIRSDKVRAHSGRSGPVRREAAGTDMLAGHSVEGMRLEALYGHWKLGATPSLRALLSLRSG